MSKPTINAVLRMQGNVLPLKDGRVPVEGFDLVVHAESDFPEAFRRMVRQEEFEVCELALTTYVIAREQGAKFTALPIFLVREFHHGAILFNRNAGISSPEDLEGRRVGVDRGYTVTTGVWARAILAEEHGVDLERATWVLSGDEHVEDFRRPANVMLQDEGRDMKADLISGALPATVGFFTHDIGHPDVLPLHHDGLQAGLRAFDSRAHYPINHLIVVRNDVLGRHPDLPKALFDAFAASKRIYLRDLSAGRVDAPNAIDRMHLSIMERIPDPLPYGLEPNRALLDNFLGHCLAQGILKVPVPLDDLFVPSTQGLAG